MISGRSILLRGQVTSAVFLGLLIGLLAFAPAQWADVVLARATNGALRLAQPSGTLWAGKGQLQLNPQATLFGGALESTGPHSVLVESVQWRISLPGPIATFRDGGSIALYLRSERLVGDIRSKPILISQVISTLWGNAATLTLSSGQLTLPELDLRKSSGLLGFYRPQFRAQLNWSEIKMQQMGQSLSPGAQFQVVLSEFASGLSPIRPLGNYQLTVRSESPFNWQVMTLNDAVLRVEGSGQWRDRPQGKLVLRCARSCEFIEGMMASVGKKTGDLYETALGQ